MEDLRILKHAKHYMNAMSEGINPLNGEFASANDTISQERIQKCCAYVADILDKLIENGGEFGTPKKQKFSITPAQINSVKLSDTPIGINEFAKRINSVTGPNMRGISGTKIADWLVSNGYLSFKIVSETKKVKTPNERSFQLGITSTETVDIKTGEIYEKILYNANAQKFILDNIQNISNSKTEQE